MPKKRTVSNTRLTKMPSVVRIADQRGEQQQRHHRALDAGRRGEVGLDRARNDHAPPRNAITSVAARPIMS
jgi:hypothetical protein